MNDDVLIKLHNVENYLLSLISNFCDANEIEYSLTGGNLIGAIRNDGFIPWDDDMDIIMTRNDFIKFKDCWNKKPIEKCSAEFESFNPRGISHSKIFLDNTLLCSESELKKKYNHGIWVDIFVLDKAPVDPKIFKKFLKKAKTRILLSRRTLYKKGSKVLFLVSLCTLLIPRFVKNWTVKRCERFLFSYKDLDSEFNYIELSAPNLLSYLYDKSLTDGYIKHKYDNYSFKIFKNYDLYLKVRFGNYMELPPVEERVCKHKPEVINFGDYSGD